MSALKLFLTDPRIVQAANEAGKCETREAAFAEMERLEREHAERGAALESARESFLTLSEYAAGREVRLIALCQVKAITAALTRAAAQPEGKP